MPSTAAARRRTRSENERRGQRGALVRFRVSARRPAGKINGMAVTEERTASPSRAELFDVFVGLLSEIDAERDGSPSNAFHDRLCEAVCRLTSMERAVLFLHDPADRRTGVAGGHGIEREGLRGLQ